MSLYPEADVKLLPANDRQAKITPMAIIVHSAAGRGSLHGWWLNPLSKGLECHFWVSDTGRVEQYMDTTVRADANGEANSFAISIETESTREATERWTPAAAAAITKLIAWLCREHVIPAEIMAHKTAPGLGWHVMFGAPGPWTKARGKTCPGPARIPQFVGEIVPRVQAATGGKPSTPTAPARPSGALTVSEAAALNKRIDAITADYKKRDAYITGWAKETFDGLRARDAIIVGWAKDRLNATDDDVADLQRRLDTVALPDLTNEKD